MSRPFAVSLLLLVAVSAPAVAQSTYRDGPPSGSPPFEILVDTDGDGLDDALEVLRGTSYEKADTDNDGLSDLEELAVGRDPLEVEATGPGSTLVLPSLRLEVYSMEDDVVLQVFALYRADDEWLGLGWGTEDHGLRKVDKRDLLPYVVDVSVMPTQLGAEWQINRLRLRLPREPFLQEEFTSLAIRARLDGVRTAAAVNLLYTGSELVRVNADVWPQQQAATWGGGGPVGGNAMANLFGSIDQGPLGGQGGVYPVEPTPEPEPERTPDSLCVQALDVVSASGNIVIYRVVAADCVDSPATVCIPGCSGTVGSTVIGIDILGLLGTG